MTTIYDVAKRAGVSAASVSLVMNDPDTRRVGAKRREIILRAARELAYQPNSIARALSEGCTKILGLLIPMRQTIFVSHFIAEVLSGVQTVAAKDGYDLMLFSHLTESGRVTSRELAKCRYVDGMAVLNTRVSSKRDMEETIRDLTATGLPFVMMNGYSGHQDINYVGIDDMRTGKMAAEYLVKQGRKRFAALGGSKRNPMPARFFAGIRAGLAGTALRLSETFTAYSEYDVETVETIAARWFQTRNFPDAFLIMDEQMVPPVYRAIHRRGLAVGRDVAIISRGSSAFAESLTPKLTTIEISGYEIGEMAGQLLLRSLGGTPPPPQKIVSSSRLLINASA